MFLLIIRHRQSKLEKVVVVRVFHRIVRMRLSGRVLLK